MNAFTTPLSSLKQRRHKNNKPNACVDTKMDGRGKENRNKGALGRLFENASFTKWGSEEVLGVGSHHPIPCLFAASLLMFMAVEYTLRMIPPSSQPFDLGFVGTRHLHLVLKSKPKLNTLLAGLNTVFVGMQTGYILWTWVVEGRPRATISALFMFTFRGILGYSTQLPLPEGFLGSGADFPVGNVSFFLFYSGHVAASVIASLDMRRMHRWDLARTFDTLNVMQMLRLLATRGHYTIDLAVGIGAGILFDSLAGKYEESKKRATIISITKPTESPIWDALNVSFKSTEKGAGR